MGEANLGPNALEGVARRVREWGARVLAMTVMPGPQLGQAVPFARELKRRHPELIMVWGGDFPTQHYEVCVRAPYVDYVGRGHGEGRFLPFLDPLRTRGAAPPRAAARGRSPRWG